MDLRQPSGRALTEGRSILSLRLFADAPGAARSRRPTDVVLVALSALVLIVTVWSADPPGQLSADLSQLAEDSPAWVLSIWQVLFDGLFVWAGVLLLLALLRRHFIVAASAVIAGVVAVLIAYLCQRLAVAEPISLGDMVERLTVSEGPAAYPAIRVAVATAIVVVFSPAISRPFRFFGRLVIAFGAVAVVGLGAATVTGTAAGLAVGVLAASLCHLAIGSPGGRPSRNVVRQVLAELGVAVDQLEPALLEPAGVVLMDATHVDGTELTVKVYGRDAWDGQFITKLWRWAWYRDGQSSVFLSRLHQVEHEALMTMWAGRSGTPTPDVLVAGKTSGGDTAIVATAGGRPVLEAGLDPEALDALLVELWSAMGRAHDDGIVHGALDLSRVTVGPAGGLVVVDWSAASVAATSGDIDVERAQILALTALVLGPARAVTMASDSLGAEALGRTVQYLQEAALTVGLRRDLDRIGLDLDDVRDEVAEAAGVDQVELVQLRRVTVKGLLTIALVAVAAWLLISSLAEIGFDTIVEELSNARWGYVLMALVVAQVARIFSAVGTTGATVHPLPLGPTAVLEFAITFVNLVIPSSAARLATKMRYFQKAGMTLTAAGTMSAIDSLAGFTVQITVLASALLFGVGGIEFDIDIDQDAATRLLTLIGVVVVVLVVAFVVALRFVPSVRERVEGPIRQLRESLRAVRSPERLGRLLGGNLMAEVTFASVLGLCVLAYGESLPLMTLLVVNVAVALLAGVMPIPGGVGVTEAALTAGLVAAGVSEAAAFAAAITTRLCTFYLPPIWGWFAMRWLRDRNYL